MAESISTYVELNEVGTVYITMYAMPKFAKPGMEIFTMKY